MERTNCLCTLDLGSCPLEGYINKKPEAAYWLHK
ncbi:hypothetical protein F383_05289 [Gossypium arboreum]|uniref:Uncharacterized protein n=1 Tax=Gossypium arboreum TaxID=29729 RepID=A0A0B0PZK4_GOSAR|nr:hypothetical protein F383_05289 [Gossypium arboreum]